MMTRITVAVAGATLAGVPVVIGADLAEAAGATPRATAADLATADVEIPAATAADLTTADAEMTADAAVTEDAPHSSLIRP